MDSNSSNQDAPIRYRPTVEEVTILVRQAASHPLGTNFLAKGAIDAVAATFGVHAFVVDEARRRLRDEVHE
jgi:hypothetical protein